MPAVQAITRAETVTFVKVQDVLLAISVPVIWGLGFTLSKAALDQFPPILLIALRFSITAMLLVWFFKPPWASMGRIFLIAISSAVIQYSLTYTGLKGLDVSTAAIVIQLEVPFAALLAAVFLKDHLGWRRLLGMVLAFIGIGLIAGEPQIQENWTPTLLVASGAIAWSVGQVLIKTLGGQVGGFLLITWVAVIAAPSLFVSSYIFETGQIEAVLNADWRGWGVVLYLALIMNGLGYATWYHLLGKHDINQVMPFLLLVPVTSVVGGMVLLDEQLTILMALGGIIVIAGVGIITVRRPRLAGPYTELSMQSALPGGPRPDVPTWAEAEPVAVPNAPEPAAASLPEPVRPRPSVRPSPVGAAARPAPTPRPLASPDPSATRLPIAPARSIEEAVRAHLRPVLRTWVDQLLPDLVHRMVRREIRALVRRSDER